MDRLIPRAPQTARVGFSVGGKIEALVGAPALILPCTVAVVVPWAP